MQHLISGNAALTVLTSFVLFAFISIFIVAIRQFSLIVNELHSLMPFVSDPRLIGSALVIVLAALALSPAGIAGFSVVLLLAGYAFSGKRHRLVHMDFLADVAPCFPSATRSRFLIEIGRQQVFQSCSLFTLQRLFRACDFRTEVSG